MSSALTKDLDKDVRMIQRGLAKGFMTLEEADKLRGELPDVADKGDWVDVTLEEEETEETEEGAEEAP